MRRLATVRRISEIRPIPNADAIEVAVVDGWEVVVKKGQFVVGQLALYCEIDAFIPNSLAPFLTREGKEPREFNGIKGERLRTIRLRGQISQGLLLPLEDVIREGMDLSDLLNIVKWEREIPAQLRGVMKGTFPSFIRKTDQERIQNLPEIFTEHLDTEYEVSLKLDGSSCTVFCNQGEVGVCSRNIDLKLDGDNADNTFVKTAQSSDLLDLVKIIYDQTQHSYAIQGELMGPGVQGNREGFSGFKIFIFDIWSIDDQRYLTPEERWHLCNLYNMGGYHIPMIAQPLTIEKRHQLGHSYDTDDLCALAYATPTTLRQLGCETVKDLLAYVQECRAFSDWRQPIEGLVFKAMDGSHSFKAINNLFLEREKD